MKRKTVLLVVHRYSKGKNSTLEKDMAKILYNLGYRVLVVAPLEREQLGKTQVYNDGEIKVLYVKTGNNFGQISKLEKIITILMRPFQIEKSIKNYYKDEKIDLIFGYTPFMANYNLFLNLKRNYKAKTILFLWDIFPQNAKDLNMIKNKFIFNFLKYREKMMYRVFDKIICNCEGQIDYIIQNNYKEKEKLVLVRNLELDNEKSKKNVFNKIEIKKQLGYEKDDIISVFGGNMGEPQELENLLDMIKEFKEYKRIKFLFVGDGTQKGKLKNIKEKNDLTNLKIMNSLERSKYEEILSITDIGLISLNKKYTVPNFPTKVTGYIKKEIPIFASLDNCSMSYLGKFIKENRIGEVARAGDKYDMKEKFLNLIKNLEAYKNIDYKKIYMKNFDANILANKLKEGIED